MLTLDRVEIQGCGPFLERIAVDLGKVVVVTGKNAQGKTWFLRCVACLLGQSGESAASLVSTDAMGAPVPDVVPEIVGFASGDGERYKIARRGGDLRVQIMHEGAWTSAPGGTPDKALAMLFDRKSSPEAFLSEKLSEEQRIVRVLEVSEADSYDRATVLEKALDGAAFKLLPIPDGLHPLEDLARVQAQIFASRTEVEKMRRAAASAAERLATGLTAEPPEDVAIKIQAAQLAVDKLRAAQQQTDSDHRLKVQEFRAEADGAIKDIEDSFQARCKLLRETTAKLSEDTGEALLDATRELAGLRTQGEIVVADKARRDESEKARAEAQALAARHAALTRAIQSLKTQAAKFISDSFPGVSVQIDDAGKRSLWVRGDNGDHHWSDTNEARRNEVAARWAALHQAKRGGGGPAQLMLILLDRGEGLDAATERRLLAEASAHGQVILTRVTDGELAFEEV